MDRSVAFWASGVLLVLLLNSVILAANLTALITNQMQVRQSQTVLTALAATFSLLQDAETGQRGFIITGDETFLDPYIRAQRNLDPQRVLLQAALAAENSDPQPYIILNGLIDKRLALLAASTEVRRANGFDGSRELVLSNGGKDIMDQIRAQVGELQQHENERLRLLTAEADRNTRNTLLTFSVATLISLGLLLLVSWLINRTSAARRRREASQELLTNSGAALAAALDERTTFEIMARIAVPIFADICAIDTLGEDGLLHRTVTFARDQNQQDRAAQIARGYPLDQHAPSWAHGVLRDGQALLLADFAAARAALPAEYRDIGPSSAIIAPLLARGRAVGAALFLNTNSDRTYTAEDLKTAEELARRTAIAADNARLFATTQQAVRIRDQFLSIASHELKTPLTALLGNATLFQRRAQRDGTLSERDLRALRVVVDQGQRLNRLIGVLLDVSRMEVGQFSVQRQPLDLRDVVQRVVDEFEPSLDNHSLQVQLPETPLSLLGDELRLDQVLRNLVQNAIKYTPDGGVITVTARQDQANAIVTVEDTGVGIATNELPALFERFYRTPNATANDISGLGVGLYVVREIVRLHEGSILAESQPGQGSRFTVQLPLLSNAGTLPA